MNVLIVHDAVSPDAREDERDALVQAGAICAALRELGHSTDVLPLTLDLETASAELRRRRPDVIFNLVESLGGHGRLIHLAPALFEALGIPYAGAQTGAMFFTSNKVLARRVLAPLPMPPLVTLVAPSAVEEFLPGRYIIKSIWEDASLGLDDNSIVDAASLSELRRMIARRSPALGGEAFADRYVDGREFNLSLLTQGPHAPPQVLPPAEILFTDFPPSKPRIVGYAAKWHESSFEFRNTNRSFNFAEADLPLLAELSTLARSCWKSAGLRGYARVDFRIDESGRPWIIEINANPCLSPDAGFVAAAAQAGVGYEAVIRRILDDAMPVA